MTEPTILTAPCYFWRPATLARERRANEARRRDEVAQYFEKIGFAVGTGADTVEAVHGTITVRFHYRETTGRVYRYLQIQVAGKRSNIRVIRKIAKEVQ